MILVIDKTKGCDGYCAASPGWASNSSLPCYIGSGVGHAESPSIRSSGGSGSVQLRQRHVARQAADLGWSGAAPRSSAYGRNDFQLIQPRHLGFLLATPSGWQAEETSPHPCMRKPLVILNSMLKQRPLGCPLLRRRPYAQSQSIVRTQTRYPMRLPQTGPAES